MILTMGGVSSFGESGPGRLTEATCLGIAGTVETGRRIGGGSEYTSTGGSPITGTKLSGKILERMNNSIKRLGCCGKDSVITLFLLLSLLPSGADQSLNLDRSTTIRTIATDEEEKTISLRKIEKVY